MVRPRIAVVTSLFPLRAEPYRGKPIYETVRRLGEWADVEAFCPIAVYPRALQPHSYQFRRADKDYSPPDVPTRYFDYRTLPFVGRALNGASAARAILPALRRFRPDLVLGYWVYPDAYAAVRAAAALGVPAVAGARGSDLLQIHDGITRRRSSFALSRAAAVLTVSEELRRRAIELGASASRVHMIANGCDTEVFRPQDRAEARQALGIPAGASLVLYVGHLYATKGLNELADAVAALPAVTLACVGEGPLRETLMGRGVLVPGSAPAPLVARWLAAADVFCLPSYSEGCPNVVLEALSSGRPVVGTTVGAIPDLLTPSSGILVPPRDSPALARALQTALAASWSPGDIAAQCSRGWRDAARDTFEVCSSLLSQ